MLTLIADKFPAKHTEELKKISTVEYKPDVTTQELEEIITGADILIVRSKEVRNRIIENGQRLSLIVRAGAGYNTIDVDTASGKGIYVSNCPGKNSVAVAELTLGLILALDRRIPDNVIDLRNGKWDKKEYGKADGLHGKTLGIIGLGSIGQEVLKRAKPFGLKCAGWSRSMTPERAEELGIRYCGIVDELVRISDIITVHVAYAPETENLINAGIFDSMKPGTILINTSRGGVVDEKALLDAIKNKGIRAGLDVFEKEPKSGKCDFTDPILNENAVYGTHHIGASTNQAQNAIADETVRIIKSFIERGEVPNCVNLARKTPAKWQLSVRHYDKVGVLANVLAIIKRNNINIQDMTNTIFEGAKAAICKMNLDSEPGEDVISEILTNRDEIISITSFALEP